MLNSLNLLPMHQKHWDKYHSMRSNKRVPQSLLLVGPAFCFIEQFTHRLIASLLCTAHLPSFEPCEKCPDCLMILEIQHPDIQWIQPEKPGSAIKIDQIRELQAEVYKTPQRGSLRFVVIKSAECMNNASANALLKILEEPPEHTHFILIATQLATLPATILSRCQLWRFSSETILDPFHLLQLSQDDSSIGFNADILNQKEMILTDLLSLLKGKTIPSILAVSWKEFPLKDLLWLLYLINAQLLAIYLSSEPYLAPHDAWNEMVKLINPTKLFHQIDKINTLQKKISHNVNINFTLAIEDLLMDCCDSPHFFQTL